MERRTFLKGLMVLGACPLCVAAAKAAGGGHWGYSGEGGPDHWGSLSGDNLACSAGTQQSPVDISGAIDAELPSLKVDWKAGPARIVNNGHTIQINAAEGSTLMRGDQSYSLLQFHFHAPSEHLVDGKSFPMEVHFVHKSAQGSGLGVLGVFVQSGAAHETMSILAASFPGKAGGEADITVDPNALLPSSLSYWTYEGSLTTPPCSEVVDWMVLREPLSVADGDIARFTELYDGNARPVLPMNRRFILSSS